MTYRIIHVYEDGFEDVSIASTLEAAKHEADDRTAVYGAEFAEVYDDADHVVYQSFS